MINRFKGEKMRVSGVISDAAKDEPVHDAKVDLYVDGVKLATLYSDSQGGFEYDELSSYIGKTLTCYVEKEGYSPQEVDHGIELDEVLLEIRLPVHSPEQNEISLSHPTWWRIVIVAVAAIVFAIILFVLLRHFLIPSINEFHAASQSIVVGSSTLLEWRTSNADKVSITPDIGEVEASGSREISPSSTTKYTLSAENRIRKVEKEFQINVIAYPTISEFSADQLRIERGNSTILEWEVSGADEVRIEPGIGDVGVSGRESVAPNSSTMYTLVAKNVAGQASEAVTITVALPPPLTVSPLNGAVIYVPLSGPRLVRLKWQPVDGAASYSVDIDRQRPGGTWEQVARLRDVEWDFYEFRASLERVELRWRVWAASQDRTDGNKTDWQEFVTLPGGGK